MQKAAEVLPLAGGGEDVIGLFAQGLQLFVQSGDLLGTERSVVERSEHVIDAFFIETGGLALRDGFEGLANAALEQERGGERLLRVELEGGLKGRERLGAAVVPPIK